MYYILNKLKARTLNKSPTLTDQSQARETDINVIVRRMGISGQAPRAAGEPMYGDFTQFPQDLRDFIHTARGIETHRRKLPEALRNLSTEEILALTPDQLTTILTPPKQETPNAKTQGDQKPA